MEMALTVVNIVLPLGLLPSENMLLMTLFGMTSCVLDRWKLCDISPNDLILETGMKQVLQTRKATVVGGEWSGCRLDLLPDIMGQETEPMYAQDQTDLTLRSWGHCVLVSLQQACCVSLSHFSVCPADNVPWLSSHLWDVRKAEDNSLHNAYV